MAPLPSSSASSVGNFCCNNQFSNHTLHGYLQSLQEPSLYMILEPETVVWKHAFWTMSLHCDHSARQKQLKEEGFIGTDSFRGVGSIVIGEA